MNILVLGSGGREHAIYEKIRQSPEATRVWFGPGNAGVADENRLPVSAEDFTALEAVLRREKIDVLFVGPEIPLALGIRDYFAFSMPELKVFGPNKRAANLEASKIFSWEFMEKAGIPQAQSGTADSVEAAHRVIRDLGYPLVIKADGLAAGKGVSIHHDDSETDEILKSIFQDKVFGTAGSRVLIQKFMHGTEASLFALCNGSDAVILPNARDYKRVFDGQQGPNTGGMGSICPGGIITEAQIGFVRKKIVEPVLKEFRYTGILYVGLMIHSGQPEDLSVVEFNCRLGDPETQSVMPMLEPSLLPYVLWSCGEDIAIPRVQSPAGYDYVPFRPGFAVNVVVAASGYPGEYQKSIPLHFPEKLPTDLQIIHAGTKREKSGLVSSGGRIFSVVATGRSAAEARKKVYDFLEELKKKNDFGRLHFRTDIGV